MQLILAPMEGVIDFRMRRMLTALGGYNRCVTEFVRVSDCRVPAKVFYRLCPELASGGKTDSGVPVYVQLLGGDPGLMADSARVAERIGALGIDINFGCPAKLVNRRDGGSVLLREPARVRDIVAAVRDRVDATVPVCAKIRLGFDSPALLEDIVDGIDEAGADELCIHARTRQDGYKPPAYWHEVGRLEKPNRMRLIINGEIWTRQDAEQATLQSGCTDLMIGRGGLARPDLALMIQEGAGYQPLSWLVVQRLVEEFFLKRQPGNLRYAGNRTKQWLGYLRKQYLEANIMFERIKRLRDEQEIAELLAIPIDYRDETFS